MEGADRIIEEARKAFESIPRPEHFTNHEHCEECADHDVTLSSYDPDTLPFEVVGNPAWDPMCFVTQQAFLYLFPGLIRLALNGEGDEDYLEQFLFHVTYDGLDSRFFYLFNTEQRTVTLEALRFIAERNPDRITSLLLESEMETALTLWQTLVDNASA
jgi:hypothetical protein